MTLIVLGAGVTGLTFANSVNASVKIFEQSEEAGGYCRTTKRGPYTWDRAGHFFHFRDMRMKSFFERHVLGENYVSVKKHTLIYFNKNWIDFPFQSNIHQLPKSDYITCLIDAYLASKSEVDNSSFKAFVRSKYGRGISDRFLIPYNEKLYATDLNNLEASSMGRFFPDVDFDDIILQPLQKGAESYNSTFLYPKKGASQLIDFLVGALPQNAELNLNSPVSSINLIDKTVTVGEETFEYSTLVSTTPLNRLIKLCGLKEQDDLKELTANAVLVYNIGFDSETVKKFHWAYFPGDEVFYRVGSYDHIFGDPFASLYVEIGLPKGEFDPSNFGLERVVEDLKRVGIIPHTANVVDFEKVIMDPAYVHITSSAERRKLELFDVLREADVYSVGRYGEWKYCSIEDNMLDAINVAEKISKKLGTNLREFWI
ncbi:protoporphyrinogen/coproporphyrinogen oxidase [Maritalea mediterranea]|uniref:FAD-dependent oxidoreductase n=1 Tax=Maritalea mediterranea TaxID=2909667 RepID=A0ABS9E6C0_9HYPH|nr:FAD-dependent oxidoreductase [Maritalea mediterranea]MCF4098412.1 FAD-dependent oxidoreductase [Maritalea mediterranea]